MPSISLVIAAKNEEKNIRRCLKSVKWADEIIVVDDVSTDRTVEIAKGYTDKVFINNSADSQGSFHVNKNLGIDKASGDWILSLDADEIVTAELADEIKEAIENPQMRGYYINRNNYFLGKWIKGCGWYPDYILRLFRKGCARWPRAIHDIPKLGEKDKAGYLKSPLIHYGYYSLSQYFNKFNQYTSILAQQEYEKGNRVKRKNFLLLFLIKPAFYLLRKYFIQKGWREGFRGFFISFSSALVIFATYAKLWEKQEGLPR